MSKKEDFSLSNIFITNALEPEADIIPLFTDEDEDQLSNLQVPDILPILPLRNTVLFPGVLMPITVSREKSLKLIKEVYGGNRIIGTVAQKDAAKNDPKPDDLYKTGTVAQIIKFLEMPDGSTSVILQGKKRFSIEEVVSTKPYLLTRIQLNEETRPDKDDREFQAIIGSLRDLSLSIIRLSPNIPPEASFAVKNIESSAFLINFISSNSDVNVSERQELLEVNDMRTRGIRLLEILTREMQLLELKNDIQLKVRTDIDQQQREYFLHQQIKTIQDELGGNPVDQEVEEMKKKAKKKKWPKHVAEAFKKEIEKLQRLNPNAAEYSLQINYIETLLELPWDYITKDSYDLKNAQQVLDQDHYGLEKVKERILEHLAVLKLKKDLRSPILCLYGPPGVGKTSLGKSIAHALNRQYVRMSLGGLHDESEIRGHRKTYIGAMPGRIIQSLKKAGSSNPVFILDEIDKVGNDFRGDPASALLEVLDPEQNSTFYDNYLELDYDLSKVMFIATANTTSSIHPALRDRMEMIEVSGYIMEEKKEIIRRHLFPKQLEAHGIKPGQLELSDEAVEYLIESYTRESGVRELDKRMAKLTRAVAKKIAFDEPYNTPLSIADVELYMGKPRYSKDRYQGNSFAGVVTGLAWTSVGGEILFVESCLSRGKGKLTITGNLGDVMKESAMIALEYLRSHVSLLQLDSDVFDNWNIHIHVPEGAIPKDGPSAGITMATSLASAFTQKKVRSNLAMTGEITLRGKVLPVGGIKEKILAAKRAGITDIILSSENKKDIEEINEVYLRGLSFHFVDTVIEVLDFALLDEKVENPLNLIISTAKEASA